jgi:hypothetical protein
MSDPEWSSSLEWRALYEPDPEDKGRPSTTATRTAVKRPPTKGNERTPAPVEDKGTAAEGMPEGIEVAAKEDTAEVTVVAGAPTPERFRDLGDTVAQVLASAHQVAEDLRRESEAALEQHKKEVEADLRRREAALDQTEKELARKLSDAEEQAVAVVAAARKEAEKLVDRIKSDIESWSKAAQAVQDAIKDEGVKPEKAKVGAGA